MSHQELSLIGSKVIILCLVPYLSSLRSTSVRVGRGGTPRGRGTNSSNIRLYTQPLTNFLKKYDLFSIVDALMSEHPSIGDNEDCLSSSRRSDAIHVLLHRRTISGMNEHLNISPKDTCRESSSQES
jgi:hypothetical protein